MDRYCSCCGQLLPRVDRKPQAEVSVVEDPTLPPSPEDRQGRGVNRSRAWALLELDSGPPRWLGGDPSECAQAEPKTGMETGPRHFPSRELARLCPGRWLSSALPCRSYPRVDGATVVIPWVEGAAVASGPSAKGGATLTDPPVSGPPSRRWIDRDGSLVEADLLLVGEFDAPEDAHLVLEIFGIHLEWATFDRGRGQWVGCLLTHRVADQLELRYQEGSFPYPFQVVPSAAEVEWLQTSGGPRSPRPVLPLADYLRPARVERLAEVGRGEG